MCKVKKESPKKALDEKVVKKVRCVRCLDGAHEDFQYGACSRCTCLRCGEPKQLDDEEACDNCANLSGSDMASDDDEEDSVDECEGPVVIDLSKEVIDLTE